MPPPLFPEAYNYVQGLSASGPIEVSIASATPVALVAGNNSRIGLLVAIPIGSTLVIAPAGFPAGNEGIVLSGATTWLWLWYANHGLMPMAPWKAYAPSGTVPVGLWQIISSQ